jgi:alcohol dehydrogenase YqhD (iron-dependent ADH family)
MKNFEYCVPTKVIFGKETHHKTGEIIKNLGYKKVLLHYGGGSIKSTGLYSHILDSLAKSEVDFVELGGVEPNPKLSFVKKGTEICKNEGCDMILAVGGGSAIDSAKAIAVSVFAQCDPWDFWLKQSEPTAALPLGVVLTLSAAGSETSSSVVVTNEDGWWKRGFNTELVRPVFSILNPELSYTVDKYQTGCGITDIMMHTIERYFAGTEMTVLTDRLAEGLLKSVIEVGRIAIDSPKDYDARANLMWAGSLSHNDMTGLGRSTIMVCHKLEHELSGMHDSIAHGAGLSVCFPAWAKYVYKSDAERFSQYALRVWDVPDSGDLLENALSGIIATEEYFKSIGMPVRLSEFGISDMKTEEMAEKCGHVQGKIPLNANDIIKIFELAT